MPKENLIDRVLEEVDKDFPPRLIRKTLQKELQKIAEDVIDYISFNEGWEETGDKYRKHFGLKTKYQKSL